MSPTRRRIAAAITRARTYENRLLTFLLRTLGPEFSDRSDDRACVEKKRPVEAGERLANFQTDTFWTTRV